MKQALILLLICLSFAAIAFGQTSKGFIVGSVVDPNGAAVTNAAVKITNKATGANRETVSGGDGNYRLDAVDPGTYTMTITVSGFQTTTRENIVVAAAQTAEVPITLTLTGASATVEVTADSTVGLQTTGGERSNTFEQRQITELPVAGLNPTNLVFTLPGVIDIGKTAAGGFAQGTEFSVNGLRGRANNQLIDGLDNNDNAITGQSYQPTVRDGYNEVAILQSNYSAEYGRAGGAIVNVTTRSGTNRFRGSVYDVIQNSAFNSLTSGQKQRELTEVPQLAENTFGGSLGGPILKNKLFFFGSFQADLIRSSTETSRIVPTTAGYQTLRSLFPQGANTNIDYYLGIVGNNRGITNPFSVALGNGRPDVEFGTVSGVAPQPVNTYDYITRVDYTPTSRDSLSFRYLATKQNFVNQFPTVFEGFEVDVPSLTQNFLASYTRNFSPNVTNEFRFGYGYVDVLFAPRNEAVGQSGAQISFSGAGLGRGISSPGLSSGFPQGRTFNNYQFQDTVTFTVGNHTFRVGADLNEQRATQLVPFNSRGRVTFTSGGGFTALGNFVDGFSGGSGSFNRVFGDQKISPDAFYQNYFINDEFRLRENLTLNLGLRYENYGAPSNKVKFPAFAGFDVPIDTRAEQKSDNNNFAPRVSFAYSPDYKNGFGRGLFGERDTVIRGGFAVNYDVFFNNILSNTAASSPNVRSATILGVQSGNTRGFNNAYVNQLPSSANLNPLASMTTIDRNLVNPQTYVYNLGVQRKFFRDYIFDVAYVGSRGTRLFVTEQLNPLVNGVRQNPSRGSISIRTNGADSNYNSLQTRFERGYKNGFLLRGTYTFSKTIDNVSEVFTTTGATSFGSNPFDRSVDRSLSSFDVPHVGTLTALVDVPTFGTTGVLRSILKGFTLSGIYRIQSGAVENAYVGGIDLNGDGNSNNDRPAFGNPNAPENSVAIRSTLFGIAGNGYVNANGDPINLADARYIVDRNIRNGLVGRNTLRGPVFSQFDMSLQRSIPLTFLGLETARFDLRFDFFNVLNHPSFTPGTGDVTNTIFNDPYAEGEGTNRTGRIQLRFSF